MFHIGRYHHTICPYFDKQMQSCSLSAEGIYLPSRTDVQAFCMSSEYRKCSIYCHHRSSREPDRAPQQEGGLIGKRRYPRLRERRSVLLRAHAREGEIVEIATTLDFSPEGMRVLISREIAMDTPFHFFFGNSFFVPGLQESPSPAGSAPVRKIPDSLKSGWLSGTNTARPAFPPNCSLSAPFCNP
jgi:hypothetical protein